MLPALTLGGALRRTPVHMLTWCKFHYGLKLQASPLDNPAYPGTRGTRPTRLTRLRLVIFSIYKPSQFLSRPTSRRWIVLLWRIFDTVISSTCCVLCCELRDSRYCILSWKIKFYASIRRMLRMFYELFDKK